MAFFGDGQCNTITYFLYTRAKSLGVVARAKGMGALSDETGLSREQLYRSFGEEGNPTLKTLIAVIQALGIGLSTAR